MTFIETVKKAGFILAEQIHHAINPNFRDTLSFDDWHSVILACRERHRGDQCFIKLIARDRLFVLAQTYDQWEIVIREAVYEVNLEEDTKKKAIIQLFSSIQSMEECRKFKEWTSHDECGDQIVQGGLIVALLEKAVRFATGFSDWAWINEQLIHTDYGKSIRRLSEKKMFEQAATFEDRVLSYTQARGPYVTAGYRDKVFQKLVEMAKE